MVALIRTLLSPLLSLILMNLASGLFNTFVSIRLDIQGYSANTIALVSSSLYAGVLIGSLSLSRWIARVGHVFAFTVFCLVSAALVMGHALWIDPLYWSFLRVFNGFCLAGIFIVVESWFLLKSSIELRGGALSIYLAVFYLALSAGQFLINFSPLTSLAPFCITAALLGSSTLPMKIFKSEAPPKMENQVAHLSFKDLFRLSPLGFWGGIISGMVLAAVYALVPVYGASKGLNVFEIGMIMSVVIFGGLSFQWPMGRWADTGDRRRVLKIASFGAAIFSVGLGLLGGVSLGSMLAMSLLFGGFSFTIYPLSMAYLCEKVSNEQIVAATGGFILCYGLGAISGPVLAAFAMDFFGSSGLFYFLALITSALGTFGMCKK